MRQVKDLTGMRFYNLTVVRQADERQGGKIVWECVCDCGNTVFARSTNLTGGNTKSCGCLRKAKAAQRQALDLTGQRFGKLTAIKPTEKRNDHSVIWECACDCGNTTHVDTRSLRNGSTTSCGCEKEAGKAHRIGTEPRQPVDITGRRYGKLTAIRPTEQRAGSFIVWECLCDCGNTAFVSGNNLRTGNTKSCGCLTSARRLDIAGQRFGRLTAVRPTEERRFNNVVWECICDCGKSTFVSVNDLQKGNTKSCGCLTRALSIAGQRFGQLTAIRPTEKRQNGQVVWECTCDCGNTAYFGASNLKSGKVKSCGCSNLR